MCVYMCVCVFLVEVFCGVNSGRKKTEETCFLKHIFWMCFNVFLNGNGV